jgi:hypothetical protein
MICVIAMICVITMISVITTYNNCLTQGSVKNYGVNKYTSRNTAKNSKYPSKYRGKFVLQFAVLEQSPSATNCFGQIVFKLIFSSVVCFLTI